MHNLVFFADINFLHFNIRIFPVPIPELQIYINSGGFLK